MKLNRIALVRTGLVLSRKGSRIENDNFEYRQLNLKSIDENGKIDLNETIPFYASEVLSDNYLTHMGDVVVKTSEPYTAAFISKETEGLVIPSHFVVVRVDTEKVLPQYISWYLNKERIKKAFRMSCTGMLKQIRPSIVAETEIKLPPIDRQKQVVELYDIAQQELTLLRKLLKQKESYYKALINEINRM